LQELACVSSKCLDVTYLIVLEMNFPESGLPFRFEAAAFVVNRQG